MEKTNRFGSLGDVLDPVRRQLNPFPAYLERRQTTPVYFDPELDAWSVFRFADVEHVLSDHDTFSSRFVQNQRRRRGHTQVEDESVIDATVLTSDPPRHHQLRGLVSKAFNPKATAEWAPRIAEITNELLDKVASKGRMELVRDFAAPLPITVIAEMLGVPTADQERFKRWSTEIVSVPKEGQRSDTTAANEMRAYFREAIAERRQAPRRDLISGLIKAEIDNQHLTERELLDFCILLLVAGNITTTNLIGNAMICFDQHPEAVAQLHADPQLVLPAIEEVLRFYSPVQAMFRVVARDTVIGGQQFHNGQSVIAWLGSANRDEGAFPDADRFDITRTPNRHVAFGKGIHFCLGAHLARLEAKIGLGEMLQRLTDIRIERGAKLDAIESAFLLGAKAVPVEFGARERTVVG